MKNLNKKLNGKKINNCEARKKETPYYGYCYVTRKQCLYLIKEQCDLYHKYVEIKWRDKK